MSSELNPRLISRARLAVTLTFVSNGLAVGAFVARLPDVKSHLALSNSSLGTALLAWSIGVVAALGPSGKFCTKYGSAPMVLIGSFGLVISYPLLGLILNLSWFCVSLFVFGFSLAFQDVAMNSHAVTLEGKSGRRMMSVFHALFSVGGFAGGVIGGVFAQIGVGFLTQTVFVAGIILAIAISMRTRWLPAASDIHEITGEVRVKRPTLLWILGLFGLCAAIGEGSAGDWGAILARETFMASPFVSAIPYVAFSTTMVIGRFSGDRLANKFGVARAISGGGLVAGIGLAVGLVIGTSYGVIFGWLFLGLGLSFIIPLLFGTAGKLAVTKFKGQIAPSQAVAMVSGITYVGFIIGPPLLGFVADAIGLRWAMFLPAVLALLLIVSAKYAKTD